MSTQKREGFLARLWSMDGLVAGAVALLVWLLGYVFIDRPTMRREAHLAVAQTRETTASATKTEMEIVKARRPVLQVMPTIRQSASNQDIREIRLELSFENRGNSDATIHHMAVSVDDGSPKGAAAETIADTQRYYYE